MFVVEAAERISYPAPMLTHDQLMAEMIRQLDSGKIKPKDISVALGLPSSRVSEMRIGKRRIQQSEMHLVAQLVGVESATQVAGTPIDEVAKVRFLGKVAQGVWLEETYCDPDEPVFVDYDRRPGDPGPEDLFAVKPEGLSMNLRFPHDIVLICRRIPFTDHWVKSGDLVIVERHNHDLREQTCKRLELDAEGIYWLHSESDQPQFQEPWRLGKPDDGLHVDNEIGITGKVIRGIIDYDR